MNTIFEVYIPQHLFEQNQNGKLRFQDVNLKFDFIADFYQYLFIQIENNRHSIKIHSKLLKKKYGNDYKKYMDFFIQEQFIRLIKNYSDYESNTYKINASMFINEHTVKYNITNKRLHQLYHQNRIRLKKMGGIDERICQHMRESIKHIRISENAYDSLLAQKESGEIEITERGLRMQKKVIENILENSISLSYDQYGRVHSELTRLKRELKANNLTFCNEEIYHRDIKTSHPFFLIRYIAEYCYQNYTEETVNLHDFMNVVLYGDIYNTLMEYLKKNDRDKMKKYVSTFLCGKPREEKAFKALFPEILTFINNRKKPRHNVFSHKLQKMESDFIFNRVCKELMNLNIYFFTVHDSIFVPNRHKITLDEVFDKNMTQYKQELFKIINAIKIRDNQNLLIFPDLETLIASENEFPYCYDVNENPNEPEFDVEAYNSYLDELLKDDLC